MPVKKKKKKILEKAQRYHRDIHSKKLSAEFESYIVSRLREKCARRLRWRDPVCFGRERERTAAIPSRFLILTNVYERGRLGRCRKRNPR